MNTITLDGGVKRQLALPAAIVLSAHAALFLGFVSHPPVIQLSPQYAVIRVDPTPPPVMVESGSNANKPASGGPSQLQLPDIPNPISHGPDTTEIPITPELPGTSVGFRGPWSPPGGPGKEAISGMAPIDPDLLDHTPEVVRQAQPIYPFAAKIKSEGGEVMVTFVVDESGRVLNPRVVSSSDPIFDEPTLCAIEQWRFAPGTRHGVPVRFRMSVPVAFTLNG
jgi:protein TonB